MCQICGYCFLTMKEAQEHFRKEHKDHQHIKKVEI